MKKSVMENFVFCAVRVLQWDSLSPLLFNQIVNTLINNFKSEKVECIGYLYQGCLSPKHWFQCTDDTATVTTLEKNNQLLCNIFIKQATWADFIIRVDKCHTFGIKCQMSLNQMSLNVIKSH